MPGDHGLPPDSLMHVTLVMGDQTVQGADSPRSQYKTPKGSAVALQIKDVAEPSACSQACRTTAAFDARVSLDIYSGHIR
jgi:hypothetical protein